MTSINSLKMRGWFKMGAINELLHSSLNEHMRLHRINTFVLPFAIFVLLFVGVVL